MCRISLLNKSQKYEDPPSQMELFSIQQDLPCTVALLKSPPQSLKQRGAERTYFASKRRKQVAQLYLLSLPKFNCQLSHFMWTHLHKESGSWAYSVVLVRRKFLGVKMCCFTMLTALWFQYLFHFHLEVKK